MAQRHLVIECPPREGQRASTRVQVQVDDHTPIGPWIVTLVARFGYPLVDSFGAPLAYQLRSLSGESVLPMTGRFADARFPSGSCFVLEPESQSTIPMQEQTLSDPEPVSALHVSRRSLMSGGLLAVFSLLGLGSGITTSFAQRVFFPHQAKLQTAPGSLRFTVHTQFLLHQQTVRTVSWAPDEHAIASGGNDALALVWNVEGKLLQRFRLHAPVRAVAWSPGGMQLVAGSANVVSFFDVQGGFVLTENATQHAASVTSVGWASVQTAAPCALSAATDTRAVVWSGQTYQPLVVFRQHTTAIEALAALADTVATTSHGGITRVWNASRGQETHGYYVDSQQPLRSIAFSSAGSLAIGGDDGTVHFRGNGRICTQQQQDIFGLHCVDASVPLQGHHSPVRAITFSPDGTLLATGGDDKQLIIWSVQKKKSLFVQVLQEAVAALAWSPSGHFLAGASGSRVILWQIQM